MAGLTCFQGLSDNSVFFLSYAHECNFFSQIVKLNIFVKKKSIGNVAD